jgi:hypothetical protein
MSAGYKLKLTAQTRCPAGFGMATVLPMVLAPFYVGAALIGLLFPLDIMMAADSNPKLVYQKGELKLSVTGSWEQGCLCALLGLAGRSACIWCALSNWRLPCCSAGRGR